MISQPQLTWQIKCKIGLTTCKMDVLILKCKSYCFYYFELWYQIAPLEMIIHPQKKSIWIQKMQTVFWIFYFTYFNIGKPASILHLWHWSNCFLGKLLGCYLRLSYLEDNFVGFHLSKYLRWLSKWWKLRAFELSPKHEIKRNFTLEYISLAILIRF